MDIQRFFENWNLEENPFQAEEARNDAVYARTIEETVTHPDFQKVFGKPETPGTSIVFGEKGSGKTAMRLMMERRFDAHNATRDSGRVWLVRYDDLNPFLDHLSQSIDPRNPERCLDEIRLADHQDAILSLAVTDLLDDLVAEQNDTSLRKRRKKMRSMGRELRLDLAALALLYDNPRHGRRDDRWARLKRFLRVGNWVGRKTHGILVVSLAIIGAIGLTMWQYFDATSWEWKAVTIGGLLGCAVFGAGWVARWIRNGWRGRKTGREIRVIARDPADLAKGLWDLPSREGIERMLPDKGDQDKRYEATKRFLQIIDALGYSSLIVLIDRVDEPMLINSDSERMRKLIWPMMNNKFLQQENFGAKMLLPIELGRLVERSDEDFRRQARMDKQNLINPLRWTGTTLYDLCASRFRNCQRPGDKKIEKLNELFESDVDERDLVDALDQMHQPRDAFKFLYAMIQRHCQNTTAEDGQFRIPKLTLEFVRQEQSQRVMQLYREG